MTTAAELGWRLYTKEQRVNARIAVENIINKYGAYNDYGIDNYPVTPPPSPFDVQSKNSRSLLTADEIENYTKSRVRDGKEA